MIIKSVSNFIFLFKSRILRSQLTKNPSSLLDEKPDFKPDIKSDAFKPNMPDMYALQQMKALQVAQNPAFKALVDARG